MADGNNGGWQQHLGGVNPNAVGTKQYSAFRTLYVLLGGTGMKTGLRLRKRVLEAHGIAQLPFQEYLWLDTDQQGDLKSQTIAEAPEVEKRLGFNPNDLIDISLPYARVQYIRQNPFAFPWLWQWLDPAFLTQLGTNANAIAGAAQIRALGRLAFEEKFSAFKDRFGQKLQHLFRPQLPSEAQRLGFTIDATDIEVVVLCSLGGGTGSGCFLQVARALRELSADLSHNINLTGHLLLPDVFAGKLGGAMFDEVKANAYAALAELNALNTPSGQAPQPLWIDGYKKPHPRSNPFNQIYLVGAQNQGLQALADPKDEDAYDMVADVLFLDFDQSNFGTQKRSHRCNMTPWLANHATVWAPVPDGTGAVRRYTFRYPTAFGSYGLARVPFDRRRYTRGAAAHLGRELVGLLLNDPAPKPQEAQITADIDKRLHQHQLRSEDILARLLTVGTGAARLQDKQVDKIKEWFNQQRAQAGQPFATQGNSQAQRLQALNGLNERGHQLGAALGARFSQVQSEVNTALDRQPNNPTQHGPDARHIDSQRDSVSRQAEADLSDYVREALADPEFQGLYAVRRALNHLKQVFANEAQGAGGPPGFPPAPELELHPDPLLLAALDQQAAAEAIWLPGFRQIARGHANKAHSEQIDAAAARATRQINDHLAAAETALIAWVQARYTYEARLRAGAVFKHLAGVVGVTTQAVAGDGVAVHTGLSLQAQLYDEALGQAEQYFQIFEDAYRDQKRPLSSRHAPDNTPWSTLGLAVQQHVTNNTLQPDASTWRQALLNLWDEFFIAHNIGAAMVTNDGSTLVRGVAQLVQYALSRQHDATPWNQAIDQLEAWTAQRLATFGGSVSALSLLGTSAQITAALDKAAKGASPYLTLNPALGGNPQGAQPKALLGVADPKAAAVLAWVGQQTGVLQGINPLVSDGGSAVIYVEQMALPIFHALAPSQFEQAYRQVASKGLFDQQKRHTERAILDLPVLLPPQDPAVTAGWFQRDRLALEAVLLGVFVGRSKKEGQLTYTVTDPKTAQQVHHSLPETLTAIATRLRESDPIHDAINRDVSARRQQVLSDPQLTRKALALANWTQNRAFPQPNNLSHLLEHDLAASLMAAWHILAQKQGHLGDLIQQASEDLANGEVEKWCPEPEPVDGVRARSLATGVYWLRHLSLPPAPRPTSTPGSSLY